MINQIEQNPGKQAVDTAIANTSIHDCDDSTYEVHVSAATQHMLAQLRENFITGLNIYSLIEATMLKYAESHATKEYLLVKSTQAYKQLNESTTKELGELRQLVEVLKKENDELRNELDGYRNKATVVEVPVTEDDVENAPILVTAPDIEHSSEHTVTLSDEDIQGIRGNSIVEIGNSVVKAIPTIRHSADEVKPNDVLFAHPHPNGAGNGVFVSTGKPDTDSNEKIRVTEYSKVANTRI